MKEERGKRRKEEERLLLHTKSCSSTFAPLTWKGPHWSHEMTNQNTNKKTLRRRKLRINRWRTHYMGTTKYKSFLSLMMKWELIERLPSLLVMKKYGEPKNVLFYDWLLVACLVVDISVAILKTTSRIKFFFYFFVRNFAKFFNLS